MSQSKRSKQSWTKHVNYDLLTDEDNVLAHKEISLRHQLMIEFKDKVVNAIANVLFSPREKQVYHLHCREGMTYEQISTVLGITESSAREYHFRVAKKMDKVILSMNEAFDPMETK